MVLVNKEEVISIIERASRKEGGGITAAQNGERIKTRIYKLKTYNQQDNITKKILHDPGNKNSYQCPECKKLQGLLDGIHNSYCWNCGIKLEWEEE